MTRPLRPLNPRGNLSGAIPKWSKGADCKSAIPRFESGWRLHLRPRLHAGVVLFFVTARQIPGILSATPLADGTTSRYIGRDKEGPLPRALRYILGALALTPFGLVVAGSAQAQEPVSEEAPQVAMPTVSSWVEAPFPAAAEADGVERAEVLLRVALNEAGLILNVEVIEASPTNYGFAEAAEAAVYEMAFTPATQDGEPIPVQFEFKYIFTNTVDESAEDEPPPVNLMGVVRELGTRALVSDAIVTVTSTNPEGGEQTWSAVTDQTGAFSFSGVAPGPASVRITGPEHIESTVYLDIADGEVTEAKLWVRKDNISTNEVVVVGQRERPPEVTRRSITTKEIRRIPGTFGDPVKVIQTLPGAARSPFGTGLLIIRGANPEDSGVYVDGIRIPLIYHLTGTTSVLAPDLVESVDYLPGGYAAGYGRTLAGTIDVRTTSVIEETRINAGADVLDAQAYMQTNVMVGADKDKPLGIAIGGRRSYIDVFLPLFLDENSFSIKPRYYDYQFKLIAPTPAHRRFSVFVYGFDDTLEVSTPEDQAQGSDADTQGNILTKYNSHRAIVNWEEKLHDRWNFSATASIGVDSTVFGVGDTFTFDGESTLFQARTSLAFEAADWLTVTHGSDILTGPWKFTFRAPLRLEDLDDPIGERDPIGIEGAGRAHYPDTYLRFDIQPLKDKDALLILPSIRWNVLRFGYGEDDKAPFNRMSVDPRISAVAKLSDAVRIKGSTGIYHQPPQPSESIGVGTTPDVGYERAWNSSVGLSHQINDAIQWEAELFWRDMSRLIDVSDDFQGTGTQAFANVGLGRAYGLEVIARHQPVGRFFGWVSYTLSRSERKSSVNANWTPFDFDQTHILSAQAAYDLPKDVGVSFQVQYVTGNPDTPLDAGVYDVDNGVYNGFRAGASNSQRVPPFFQTSLRFDKTFVYRSWELATYVDLLNVVRGVNPEFTVYNYDYSDYAYVRGLPFIPNIGIEAKVRR